MQLGDLQQIVQPLLKIQQFDAAALILSGGINANQLTQSGAIYVRHAPQIQDDLLRALRQQLTEIVAKKPRTLAEGNPPLQVNRSNITNSANFSRTKPYVCTLVTQVYMTFERTPARQFAPQPGARSRPAL